jgi:hypothetical protein
MAALHETIIYDVEDLIIWPMLTDPANASPTYGSAIDVPGVSAVSMDPTITSNSLKGDGRTMAARSRLDDFAFKATYGKAALGVIDAILGGDGVADSGSANAEIARSSIVLPKATGVFAVRFVITDVDLGLEALIVTAFKAQLSGGTLIGSGSDAYGQPALEATCVQPNHNVDDSGTMYAAGGFTPCVDFALFETLPTVTTLAI